MKIIRYLIFIPICLFVISLVYTLFAYLLSWFVTLGTFWLILIFFLFGGAIWGLFKGLSALLMSFTSRISPNLQFSFWSVLIISGINGIWTIVNTWTMDINYSFKVIFASIIFTILIIELTMALIMGSAASLEEEY